MSALQNAHGAYICEKSLYNVTKNDEHLDKLYALIIKAITFASCFLNILRYSDSAILEQIIEMSISFHLFDFILY